MSVVLVTGANRGIGLELCRQYTQRGEDVIAVCRTASPALRELGTQVVENIDVTDDTSIGALKGELQGQSIDILVNCAGILTRESLNDLDIQRIRRQFEVNAIAPLRVTEALQECLRRGSKVVIVTSRMGSIEDNTSGGYYGYRMSKAAVNIVARSLAHDLKDRGVSVLLLHPGFVATEMTGHQGIPVSDAATNLIARIDTLGPEESGSFWHANGDRLPW